MSKEHYQTTLEQEVHFSGIGLHTGAPSHVTLFPAPENTGLVFVDKNKKPLFKSTVESVLSTDYCVTLGTETARVKTVEHLLSALLALSLSNAFIYCDGPEIPLMDGSSWPFFFHIRSAGLKVQQALKIYAVITKELTVNLGQAQATIAPSQQYEIDVSLEYAHPFLCAEGLQRRFTLEGAAYEHEIARARTYGFTKDLPLYQKHQLALGANYHNTLIFDDLQPISDEPPRFKQEIVRHKILDIIGDLSLIGAPLIGAYHAICPGHTLNVAAVRALLAQEAVSWLTYEQAQARSVAWA